MKYFKAHMLERRFIAESSSSDGRCTSQREIRGCFRYTPCGPSDFSTLILSRRPHLF